MQSFRKNLKTNMKLMIRLEMKKLKYGNNREAPKISALSSGKVVKY